MKTFLTLLFALVFGVAGLQAQTSSTPESFLTGKWSVFVKGTPQGDVTLPVRFEIKEGKLKGYSIEAMFSGFEQLASKDESEAEETLRKLRELLSEK